MKKILLNVTIITAAFLFLAGIGAFSGETVYAAEEEIPVAGETANPVLTTYRVDSGNYTVILNGVTAENGENLANAILDSVNAENHENSVKFTNSDFVDADKYTYTVQGFDSFHCWCASTSNILRISGWAADFSNPVVKNGHTSYEDDLLAFFTSSFTDAGNSSESALSYYFDGMLGKTVSSGGANLITEPTALKPSPAASYKGYMPKICSQALASGVSLSDHPESISNLEKLENTAIEFSVIKYDRRSGQSIADSAHSMTITGVVVDTAKTGNDRYVALVIADSDNETCAAALPASFEEANAAKLAKTNSYTLKYTETFQGKFGIDYNGSFAELTELTCLPFKTDSAVSAAMETASNATCDKSANGDAVISLLSVYGDGDNFSGVYETTETLHMNFDCINRNESCSITAENAGQKTLDCTLYVYRDGELAGTITKGLSFDLSAGIGPMQRVFGDALISESGLFGTPGNYIIRLSLNTNGCKEAYIKNNVSREVSFKIVSNQEEATETPGEAESAAKTDGGSTPKTGDGNHLLLYFFLITVSALLIAGILITGGFRKIHCS